MKRVLTTGVCSLLLVVSLTAGVHASGGSGRAKGKPAPRAIELVYSEPTVPYVVCPNCPAAWPRPGERFITVEVLDSLSPTGYADIAWSTSNLDDPGYFSVCGATVEPQRIPANADLTVYPWAIPGPDCAGFSTSGTVRITFTRHP
jgi:hypothetical protein